MTPDEPRRPAGTLKCSALKKETNISRRHRCYTTQTLRSRRPRQRAARNVGAFDRNPHKGATGARRALWDIKQHGTSFALTRLPAVTSRAVLSVTSEKPPAPTTTVTASAQQRRCQLEHDGRMVVRGQLSSTPLHAAGDCVVLRRRAR